MKAVRKEWGGIGRLWWSFWGKKKEENSNQLLSIKSPKRDPQTKTSSPPSGRGQIKKVNRGGEKGSHSKTTEFGEKSFRAERTARTEMVISEKEV